MGLLNYPSKLLLLIALGVISPPLTRAAIVLTDATNLSLTATEVSGNATVFADNDITGGLAGTLINYTPIASNDWLAAGFAGNKLFEGNAGPDGSNTGTSFAIANGPGAGTVTLALAGGSQPVSSIAIYNGYGNRDNGTYTLRDDSGTLGAWTIATSGSTHTSADNFWLTFDTPVTTANLFIDYVGSDFEGTVSFAAIQPYYNIPEPSTYAALLGFVMGFVALRAKSRRSRRG